MYIKFSTTVKHFKNKKNDQASQHVTTPFNFYCLYYCPYSIPMTLQIYWYKTGVVSAAEVVTSAVFHLEIGNVFTQVFGQLFC